MNVFNNEAFGSVRTVMINTKPMFVATDVAKALGYLKPNNAVNVHCHCTLKWGTPHPQSKTKTIEVNVIPERDVYRLVMRSKLPTAEKNHMTIFNNEAFGAVRAMSIDNKPWFVAKDVSDILGYSVTEKMMRHVDTEDRKEINTNEINVLNDINGLSPETGDNLGGTPKMLIINESGFYSGVMSSKLPKAKQFKRWVTSEVLPEIRRTGG